MSTYDLTLHPADAWELAHQLRYVAERIERLGPECLPDAGAEKTVLIDGETAGAISQAGSVTLADQGYLMRAAVNGDIGFMNRIADAQAALLSILSQHDLNGFQREGVMLALDELASGLSHRAEFLEEEFSTVEMTKE